MEREHVFLFFVCLRTGIRQDYHGEVFAVPVQINTKRFHLQQSR